MFDSKNTVSDRIKNKIRLERTGSDSKEGSDIKKITSCIKVKKLPARAQYSSLCNRNVIQFAVINILLRKRILTLVWLHMYSIFIVWSRNIAVGWRWRLNISGLCGHSFKMLQNRSVKKNYLSTANNYSHPLRGDSLEHRRVIYTAEKAKVVAAS